MEELAREEAKSVIEARGLNKIFKLGKMDVEVLKDINIDIKEGELDRKSVV